MRCSTRYSRFSAASIPTKTTTTLLCALFSSTASSVAHAAMAASSSSTRTSSAPTTVTPRGKSFAASLPPLPPFHKRLFLLRHGQTDWNHKGLMQGGGFDIELNYNGRDQASRVASELSGICTTSMNTVIASSHLQRALQTANYVNNIHSSSSSERLVVQDPRFGEMRFGDFEGTVIHGPEASADNKARFQDMTQRMKLDINLAWPGEKAESTLDVSKRGDAAVAHLLESNSEHQNVNQFAVVAHGRFNKVLLATLLYKDPSRYTEMEQGNTCINVLDYDTTKTDCCWDPVLINYTDHAPNANAKEALLNNGKNGQQ